MAIDTATITFDIADQLGNDFDVRRTKVWVTTNVPGDTIIDTSGNKIRLGSGNVTVNPDGTGALTVWIPGPDANPTSWQTTIHVDYPDRNARGGRATRSFGPFTINATVDLADMIAEQEVPPEYLTGVAADLNGYVLTAEAAANAAAASAAQAQSIAEIDTSDALMAAVASDPDSEFSQVTTATFARIAGNGSADDTTRLQALLSAGGHIKGKPGETYTISAPLVIGSETMLDMTGCVVQWKSGTLGNNMVRNSAATAQRTVADAATTLGSTTLTSATAAFTSADVGRTVSVVGAGGSSAGLGPLTANIVSVTNGTTVVLSVAAHKTVTGATARVYNREANIAIVGGKWRRGTAVGDTSEKLHGFFLRHIDGVTVTPEEYTSQTVGAKYAISLGDVTDYIASVRHLDTVSDGIHITGPAYRGSIPFIGGTTGDDMCAFTAGDYDSYADVAGDIIGCRIGTIQAKGTKEIYKILAGAGWRVDGIVADQATGTVTANAAWIGDDATFPVTTGGTFGLIDLGTIDVEAVNYQLQIVNANAEKIVVRPVKRTATGQGSVKIANSTAAAATIQQVVIRDAVWENAEDSAVTMDATGVTVRSIVIDRPRGKPILFNGIAGSLGLLSIRDADYDLAGPTGMVWVRGAQVDEVNINGGRISTPAATRPVYQSTGGWIKRVNLNTRITAVEQAVRIDQQTQAIDVEVRGYIGGAKRVVESVTASANVHLASPTLDALTQEACHMPAGGIVSGDVGNWTSTSSRVVSTVSTGTRVRGLTIRADVSTIVASAGDMAFNTNAALACGSGPVIYQTNWKHLHTGLTY